MEDIVKIIDIVIWPIILILIYILNHNTIQDVLSSIKERIKHNAPIDIKGVKIGSIPMHLPNFDSDTKITHDFFALIHSSWRYKKKDKEFGKKMYGIQVIINAQPDVLDQVQYVKYHLHHSYPNKIITRQDRHRYFELKELAWGEFHLKAEVKLKGEEELIVLKRYINLTDTGDRLLM